MKRTLPALLIATTLGTSSAQAAPLLHMGFGGGDGNGFIGLVGLEASVGFRDIHLCSGFDAGTLCEGFDESGYYTITGGALIDVQVVERDPFDRIFTIYTFEEGLLRVNFKWTNTGGLQETGLFTAPVFNLVNASGRFLQSEVRECEGFCAGLGHYTQDGFFIGAGLFDENVARWLGVERETQGGDFNFYLELLTAEDGGPGDETSAKRRGNLNQPGLRIFPTAVPEPGTGVLLLGGLAGMLLRRRLHRQA